jgi:hypothetical protein
MRDTDWHSATYLAPVVRDGIRKELRVGREATARDRVVASIEGFEARALLLVPKVARAVASYRCKRSQLVEMNVVDGVHIATLRASTVATVNNSSSSSKEQWRC